ncbi:MAG TPA: glutamate racemase [Epulopiscium sp.]|nr:glutamate racemase [Candidatus Epulonipiscium sp.]
MHHEPIGIFDSGLGGLTVVKEVMEHLPNESIIYFGDTARVPYGNKSKETITKFSAQIIRFLQSKGVKAIIIACNTVSSNSIEELRAMFPEIPIEGVVEPGVKVGLEKTKTGRIGIIGTEATIRTNKYPSLIKEANPKVQVFGKSCPLFVPLVEDGWIDHPVTHMVATEYLAPLLKEGIDTLILGCTHYPMLSETIQKVAGDQVTLVNPAQEAAYKMERNLKEWQQLSSGKTMPIYEFYVSDHTSQFEHMAKEFLKRPIEHVQLVDLGKKEEEKIGIINKQECTLWIATKQIYKAHTDSLEETFQGKISEKNGNIYIIYNEQNKDTGIKITNQLKVSKDGSVSVRRMGGHKSLLHFTKDKLYTTFYNTGHGTMELTFKPIVIECNEVDSGYQVRLEYEIYMGEEKLSCNHYTLEATF